MDNSQSIKQVVKEKYGKIASQTGSTCGCGCGCGSSSNEITQIFNDTIGPGYNTVAGYVPEADLGLGCGIPVEHSAIKEGDIVVDLGCGTGNDVFIARKLVGDSGKVIGIDMTEAMINKANQFKQNFGFANIEFHLGEIENLPLADNLADVVVSNCVLNLVPDKRKAFIEIYRVLKPGAHFCISDLVLHGVLPEKLKQQAELYVGCVAGALSQDEYLSIIQSTGFENIQIHSEKPIHLSTAILNKFLSPQELNDYIQSGNGIYSITLSGYKKK